MENRRFILLALLGVVMFFIYQAWQDEQAALQAAAEAAPQVLADSAPRVVNPDAPSLAQSSDVPLAGITEPDRQPATRDSAAPAERIMVETDRFKAEISLAGGDLRRAELVGYVVSKDRPDQPLALLNDREGFYFILQSGLAGQDEALASHLDLYTSPATRYELGDQEVLEVPLELRSSAGYTVRKIYRFRRGSYEIELEHQLINASGEPLVASAYSRWVRTPKVVGQEPKFTQTFLGIGFYEQDDEGERFKFRKHRFKNLDDEPVETSQTGGWIAMLQHYFVAAIIPAADQLTTYSARPGREQGFVAQTVGPGMTVASGSEQSFNTLLYLGPKLQESIGEVAPGLELTVDYGLVTPIAEPLFWLLEKFFELTGNWGWSIILLTLLVKAAFYKLSEAQYRSMAKMRKYAPRIQEIRERYEGDRERLSRAMMDLYKKEGFNPLAGCWPLLVQMPVFFALYWVLLESVELRQADFTLWLSDLSSPDPLYVLPLLFGLSMWYQQKLSGSALTMDPMQQRVMNIMPIAMTGFFAFFPAGLVLYWVVSNLIGIAQQWFITRKLEREGLGQKITP